MSTEAAGADEKVDRQARILEAVMTLLSRQGISGVSMRAVAREADVALGLVNYYYADKVSLIRAALHRIEEQDVALVEPDPTVAPEQRLRVALRRVADPEFLTTEYLSLRLQLWALAQRGRERAGRLLRALRRQLQPLVGRPGRTPPGPGHRPAARRRAEGDHRRAHRRRPRGPP